MLITFTAMIDKHEPNSNSLGFFLFCVCFFILQFLGAFGSCKCVLWVAHVLSTKKSTIVFNWNWYKRRTKYRNEPTDIEGYFKSKRNWHGEYEQKIIADNEKGKKNNKLREEWLSDTEQEEQCNKFSHYCKDIDIKYTQMGLINPALTDKRNQI